MRTNRITRLVFTLALLITGSAATIAETPERAVTLDLSADVMSNFLWRGSESSNFCVLPSATVTWVKPGLSFNVWGRTDLFADEKAVNVKEIDLTLAWQPIEALTIQLVDYYNFSRSFFGGWDFSRHSAHNLEVGLAYDFGPLSLSWNTCLTGSDINTYGDRCYATYVEVGAPWQLGGLTGKAAVGASLWDDGFDLFVTDKYGNSVPSDGFKVCNILLQVDKTFYHIPFYGAVTYNPAHDRFYFSVGLTIQ